MDSTLRPQVLFLHIEKTAGTSLRKSVIEPNLTCRRIGSLRKEVAARWRHRLPDPDAECLYGHVAYGIHHITGRSDGVYVTMLRAPVDRVASFYYYIKDNQRLDLIERHGLRDYADSVTLAQFGANPQLSNSQTRRLAGIEYDRAYPTLHRNDAFRQAMLRAAKRHLRAMPVFGLQEHFDASQRRFLRYLGGRLPEGEEPHEEVTKSRRTLDEIAAIAPGILDRIAATNDLDLALYSLATELFSDSTG